MKKLAIAIMFMVAATDLHAQFPGAPANGVKMPSAPSIGVVNGKLIDSSGKAIADASVIIMGEKFDTITRKTKEVLIKGVSTKSNGEFSFSDLPVAGKLTLKISANGFTPIDKSFVFMDKMPAGVPGTTAQVAGGAASFSAANFEKDLGKIILSINSKQL